MSKCTTHGEENCMRCAISEDGDAGVPKVHVNIVLDRSGSMASSTAQTIGGFNEYIKGLRSHSDTDYTVSLTTFDHTVTPVFVNKPIDQVPELDGTNYRIGGGTSLYDAIGQILSGVEAAAEKDPSVGHLVVIITDGEDESSREFTREQAVELIAAAEKKAVTVAYIGANPDAFTGGGRLFTASGNASASSNVTHSTAAASYTALADATVYYSSVRGQTLNAAQSMSATTGETLEKSLRSVARPVSNLFSPESPEPETPEEP